jgi:hypothetical protein
MDDLLRDAFTSAQDWRIFNSRAAQSMNLSRLN